MHLKPELGVDRANVILLFLLYVMQGVPLGLAGCLPMILQSKNVSYKEQALFSLVSWPFSLKLLWAPIVDAAYLKQCGRRKTWLVPTQYLIGVFMLLLSCSADGLLEVERPNVRLLTAVFFCLNFLAATQDIAVDGWALTMLQRHNVGYASTCNSVGQMTGAFLGNVVFLALNSPEFCNHFRGNPQTVGIVTMSSFLHFWGIVFVVVTTLVWIFKTETSHGVSSDQELGILATYKLLTNVIRLPSVMSYVMVLLTCKVGFAAADAVTRLKLIEAGVAKENLALISVPIVPMQMIVSLFISKFTAGPRPLDVYKRAMSCRLCFGLILAMVVYWTRHVRSPGVNQFPMKYYMVLLLVFALHQFAAYTISISSMSFNARISDPVIGGTYMTMLNTMANLGQHWPMTLSLSAVDWLTWKSCSKSAFGSCGNTALAEVCTKAGGTCNVSVDGYYVESVICVVLGVAWLLWNRTTLVSLQNMKDGAWRVT